MAARRQAGCHRRPRTTQERRLNFHDRDFTRGKRRNLPNAWDDISIRKQKSWKKKRNTQYRGDKDGFSYWKIEFNRYSYKYDETWELAGRAYEMCKNRGYYCKWEKDNFWWYGKDL